MIKRTHFKATPFNPMCKYCNQNELRSKYENTWKAATGAHGRNKLVEMPYGFFKSKMLYIISVILISVFFISQTSFAKMESNLPSGLCSGGYYKCDKKTLSRWSLFKNSNGMILESPDFLSVGSCSANGDSDSQIYVLLALLRKADNLYFDAKISFNNNLEKYRAVPSSKIKNIFPNIHRDHNLLNLSDSHAYIDYSDLFPFRYWLRYNRQANKMLMIGYFGYTNTYLCEFD